jgi:hypothetical protein
LRGLPFLRGEESRLMRGCFFGHFYSSPRVVRGTGAKPMNTPQPTDYTRHYTTIVVLRIFTPIFAGVVATGKSVPQRLKPFDGC